MNMKFAKKAFIVTLATTTLFVSESCIVPTPQASAAATDAQVYDIFNRNVNSYGVDLVDWQGYIANPYIKLTVKPPASASYPVTINLKASGTSRFMMDLPSQLSATGATKTLTFSSASEQKNFLLEIHPHRTATQGQIENYTFSMNVVESNGNSHTQTMPIRVLNQDDNAQPSLPLTFDYRFDTVNHVFNDPAIKNASEQAIKDWFYFFDEAPFDTVPAGAETNFVPNDNFAGNTTVTNNAPYNGEWIFLRGLNEPYSTGWNSANGQYHKRNGVTVPNKLYRSLGAALQFYSGKTPFTSMDDEQWYLSDNSGNLTDVYGLIMHEFGHGFAYSDTWPGMAAYKASGGNTPDVVGYQGIPVPLDSSYHIPGDAKYYDRQSGQTGGWGGLFPSRRWMITKLSLLIAENAGWKLNKNLAPFVPPQIVSTSLPNATKGQSYTQKLTAKGGVPFYDWRIVNGSLPAGLSLDMFTGTISGTVSNTQAQNSYTFTVQLRDYDETSAPVTKVFTISLGGTTPTPDTVANYLFNETSGTTAADASGSGNNATLNGNAAWAAGKNGNALSLNGTSAYASLPSGIVSSLGDFTVSTWVKANSLSNWIRIFDFGTGTSSHMFLTPQPGSAGLRFAITNNGNGSEQQINSTAAFPTGVWKHVAVTLSGNTGILYVDGTEVARNSNMTLKPSNLGSTTQNYIGKSQYASDPYLNGLIDEFKIYNRALSASEVSTLAGGGGGTTTPANIASLATATTSFVSSWESLTGLNDGYTPTSSSDRGHPVYGNWDNPGTTQWVEYDFNENHTISSTDVYWFADGQGIDVPASYSIQYWNGTSWVNAANTSGLGVASNQYNTTTFTPFTTNKIRLNITAKSTASTGIESWKVNGI